MTYLQIGWYSLLITIKRYRAMTRKKIWVQSLTEAFNEARVAHISIDLQDSYCNPDHPRIKTYGYGASAKRGEAVAHAVGAFVTANGKYLTNIWVAHNCASAYGIPPMHAREYLPQLARSSFHSSLPVNDNDIVICKKNYSAFDGTDLDEVLASQNIKTILLSGIFLDICIRETALDAKKYGYDVYILKDMVASFRDSQEMAEWDMRKLQVDTDAGVISPKLISKIASGNLSSV